MAAEMLRDMLIAMYCSGSLDAKSLCSLCYWATRAGCEGVDDLGVRPGVSTGNYSKHLSLVLGLKDIECQ